MEEQFIVQTSTPERKFVKVYLDFLNAGLLSGKEQIVFIHLKQYVNFADDTGTVVSSEVYPTLATLAKHVKMTEKTVRTILQSLQKKGILKIKQQGQNKPNIYKINDSAEMWNAENAEELAEAIDEIEEKRMIDILTAKGYYISKEKELVSASDQTADTSTKDNNSLSKKDGIAIGTKSQAERYSMKELKDFFEYSIMIKDYQVRKADLQAAFDILYEVLNTGKPTVRISGEDKPQAVVAGKLMKLTRDDILYAIDKFHEQTGEIKNTRAYLLTILYHAKDQAYLDLMNLGHRNGHF